MTNVRWLALVLVIAVSLTAIWYGPGKMLARAEEGLPFYDLHRTTRIYEHIWLDTQLGVLNPFHQARAPFLRIALAINKLGVDSLAIQKVFFLFLLLTPLISVHLLTEALIPNEPKILYFTASIIYIFNLFTLSQVLQRFIYPLMFVWSYLPLFLFLWVKWLDSGEIKFFLWLLISSVFFSSSFVIPSSVLTLAIPAFILWVKNHRIGRALITLVLLTLINSWWLYPLQFINNSNIVENFNIDKSVTSLAGVSKYYTNDEIMQLKQKYYFGPGSTWFSIFSRPYNTFIGKGILIFLVLGIAVSVKAHKGRIFILILVITWLLVKGTNPPFGLEVYKWLFKYLPFTTSLRNPYEKLGSVFLLSYCILFAQGLSIIKFRFVKTLIIFVICFVYLRPYWTNQIFASYLVDVPATYQAANSYLNSQDDLRLLQLPYLHGAGTSYVWGYSGEEPSNFLFDRPSLSGTYFSPTDPYLFLYKYLQSPRTYRLLQLLAVDAVVLHKDTLPGPAYQENYAGARAMLSQMEHIRLVKTFSDLDIYQLDPDLSIGWGYLSNRTFSVSSLSAGFDLVVNNDSFKLHSDSFVLSPQSPNLGGRLPNYTITKLSPIHYVYHINQATAPYTLILSVNFNQGWTAKINSLPLTNHFQVNGYANGWLVDKSGDYTVDVKFKTWPWE